MKDTFLSQFPYYKTSQVNFDGRAKFVVYSDDSTHSLILGMGNTEGEALDNAEINAAKIILSQR